MLTNLICNIHYQFYQVGATDSLCWDMTDEILTLGGIKGCYRTLEDYGIGRIDSSIASVTLADCDIGRYYQIRNIFLQT